MSDEFGRPEEEESELIELVDEEGNTETYEWLASFEMDETQYIAVARAEGEQDPESLEVLFLRIEEDEDGNDVYVSVNDEEEADAAFACFMELVDQDEEGEE